MKRKAWLHKYAVKMNPHLRKKVRRSHLLKRKPASLPVIVQFQKKMTSARLRSLQNRLGSDSLPNPLRLPLINAVMLKVTMKGLRCMCGLKSIGKIYLDGIKKASLDIATPSIGSTAVQRKKGLTGKGINVAVIDTGVYPHPDLTRPVNRIVAFKDFVNFRKLPYDDNGHGTHVAGDAAGNGWMSKGKYRGPAPKAGIVGVKVLNRFGNGSDSTIIKGVEWCIANRKRLKLRILSLSLGGPAPGSLKEDPLSQAVEKAVRAGLVVVVAAGNEGPRPRTIDSPGNSPSAITVGAVDDRRTVKEADDTMVFYSSRGPSRNGGKKPDLVAPGEAIISLRAPRSFLDRSLPWLRVGKGYFTLSGTSMSTPIVSGAAAQLLQKKPCLTPLQVKKILKKHAFRLKFGVNAAGSGEIDVRFLEKRCGRSHAKKKRPPSSCRNSAAASRRNV
ncbi:S8 family peptidase [Paenibacillus allorhizosphaerae]|uniref:Serine protease AprX n=1 Tax=Paenibacillus allorhizosphaerae TaxID=2849866 RepID=A0ABN7TKS1_9BACL|nr:S8 family peptidase [Paenibacillus allorhizosphaerae]CAG7644474.1 Serine protease AprX [Paenibacillus allorhizosphaerae]